MTTNEVAAAVESWIVELIPELTDRTYDYHASRKSKPFPDAAIEIDEMLQGESPSDVGMPTVRNAQTGWEQVIFRSWTVRVLLMVDEDPPADAQAKLQGYADAVLAGLASSRTMGDRVPWCSRTAKASFTPPFVEYEDGARGRVVTVELTVGSAEEIED